MTTVFPDGERCANTTLDGKRCRLKRESYGDGASCGVHYHARRRALGASDAPVGNPDSQTGREAAACERLR